MIIAGWWKEMLVKQNTTDGPKGLVVNVSNFLLVFIVYNYDSAIISKTRTNPWILELFSYSAAQKT
jgi:hypothetical protein